MILAMIPRLQNPIPRPHDMGPRQSIAIPNQRLREIALERPDAKLKMPPDVQRHSFLLRALLDDVENARRIQGVDGIERQARKRLRDDGVDEQQADDFLAASEELADNLVRVDAADGPAADDVGAFGLQLEDFGHVDRGHAFEREVPCARVDLERAVECDDAEVGRDDWKVDVGACGAGAIREEEESRRIVFERALKVVVFASELWFCFWRFWMGHFSG